MLVIEGGVLNERIWSWQQLDIYYNHYYFAVFIWL